MEPLDDIAIAIGYAGIIIIIIGIASILWDSFTDQSCIAWLKEAKLRISRFLFG